MVPHKYCAWCGYRYGDTDLSCTNCGGDRGFFEGDDQTDAGESGLRRSSGGDYHDRWRKVLWKQQQFEDNYVDKETFLNSLVTNANVRPFHYWAMARGSTVVLRTFSAVALFGVVFTHCWSETVSAQSLLVADTTILLCSQAVLFNDTEAAMDVRRLFILVVALAALTPILHTLTREWSDDTILALSICCLAAHILFGQYSLAVPGQHRAVSSLNAAIFASVMLASRLQSNELVFGFLLFAVAVFGAVPVLCHQLDDDQQLKLTLVLTTAATAALFPLSKFAAVAHLMIVVCVAFVCPLWLMYIQRYKSLIQGQWDEAVPGVRQ